MKSAVAAVLLFAAASCLAADLPSREALVKNAIPAADRVWRDATKEPPVASSRALFTAALTYGEAHTNLDRLDGLFALAEKMQDRDTNSKTYGNFLWDTKTTAILDKNAVDFCMQGAAPLWIRHRDAIPKSARAKLERLLQIGTDGQLRHRVSDEYTNIGLMAAVNLILLGEALGRADAAAEGAKRLDAFVNQMRKGGTHEYNSPTYYGVDLEDLVLLESLTGNETARTAARGLLEYFWTDLALNWFPAARKMSGARSRDYDYLRGLGILDHHLAANGWIPDDGKQPPGSIFVSFTRWHPPAGLRELAETRLPRLVESIWGPKTSQWRVNYVCRDIALSSAGVGYGGHMDLPLCVDFPGDRAEPRGYFIPDGRHDPYGKSKILERSGHAKTLHLQPFWAAAQERCDALALAVYREKDLVTNAPSLESHFVLPLRADEFRIGEFALALTTNSPVTFALNPDATFFMRRGTAELGLRVPWARSCDGRPLRAAFVYDGNPFGVARVTIDHGTNRAAMKMEAWPAVAFWLRIGSGLQDDEAHAKWRDEFRSAVVKVEAPPGAIEIRAEGKDGPLRITARAPYLEVAGIEPPPQRFFLAHDGDDLGRKILDGIPHVAK